jgi:hypothetical protein
MDSNRAAALQGFAKAITPASNADARLAVVAAARVTTTFRKHVDGNGVMET